MRVNKKDIKEMVKFFIKTSRVHNPVCQKQMTYLEDLMPFENEINNAIDDNARAEIFSKFFDDFVPIYPRRLPYPMDAITSIIINGNPLLGFLLVEMEINKHLLLIFTAHTDFVRADQRANKKDDYTSIFMAIRNAKEELGI